MNRNITTIIIPALIAFSLLITLGCSKKDEPNNTPDSAAKSKSTAKATSTASNNPISNNTSQPSQNQTFTPTKNITQQFSQFEIVPTKGFGNIRFKMNPRQIRNILGKPDLSSGDTVLSYQSLGCALIISKQDALASVRFGDKNNNSSPFYMNCRFKTSKGIGLGSTKSDIINLYGQPDSIRKSRSLDFEILSYSNIAATFTLANGKVTLMNFNAKDLGAQDLGEIKVVDNG